MKTQNAVLISLFVTLISCKQTTKNDDSTKPIAKTETIATPVVPVAEKSKDESINILNDIIVAKVAVVNQIATNPTNANAIYKAFREKMTNLESDFDRLEEPILSSKYYSFLDEKTNKPNYPDNLKPKIALMEKADLEFKELGEGDVGIGFKPNFYYDIFKNSVTKDYKTFLELEASDNATIYQADAGIIIPLKQLSERILNWEKFMTNYPKSELYPRVKKTYYAPYLQDYLFGMDNTPTFDFEDNTKMYPENRTEFERFAKTPNSNAAKITKLFLEKFDAKASIEDLHVLFEKEIVK